MTPTITYETDSGTLYGRIGIITNPRVGFLRYNVFLGATFGWEAGALCLDSVSDCSFDSKNPDEDGPRDRIPSAAFSYWVYDILRLMDVTRWDALEGKMVVTLWDEERLSGSTCRGIAHPISGDYIIWSEWWANVGRPIEDGDTL